MENGELEGGIIAMIVAEVKANRLQQKPSDLMVVECHFGVP
jgi:hypothetical protein